MRFEFKILSIFAVLVLAVGLFGPGNLSFDEAERQASLDNASLEPGLVRKLEAAQARFIDAALPRCVKIAGTSIERFSIVAEIESNGDVARTWRQDGSGFAICMQNLITENFYFRKAKRSFFARFEYGAPP